MKKLFLLTPILFLTACNMADVDRATTRMPPQLVTNKADMDRMEQLNAGAKPPIIYQTTTAQPGPGKPY